MRKTRKLNKRYGKTRRAKNGGGNNNVKPFPPLPASPLPSPLAQNRKLPANKGITVNVSNKKVEKDTYNHLVRERQRKRLNNVRKTKISNWNRWFGVKTPKAVPLDANGYPIKSYFNINNKGFVPESKTKF